MRTAEATGARAPRKVAESSNGGILLGVGLAPITTPRAAVGGSTNAGTGRDAAAPAAGTGAAAGVLGRAGPELEIVRATAGSAGLDAVRATAGTAGLDAVRATAGPAAAGGAVSFGNNIAPSECNRCAINTH